MAIIIGILKSKRLATLGKDSIIYGYIDIATQDRTLTIKIDAATKLEPVDIGDRIWADLRLLGNTDIMVANAIGLATGFTTLENERDADL